MFRILQRTLFVTALNILLVRDSWKYTAGLERIFYSHTFSWSNHKRRLETHLEIIKGVTVAVFYGLNGLNRCHDTQDCW